MTAAFLHDPVMVDEVVDVLAAVPAGVVLDATVGGGGHSHALLSARDDVRVLGLDRDRSALEAATERLADFADRVDLRHARFDRLADEVRTLGGDGLAGFLFDLGVSSPQIDRAERGFSYRFDGPLDMRMDADASRSAADVVNQYAVDDLARVLREFGDVRPHYRVAKAIVAARPIETTAELAEVVREATPARDRRRGDPAKQIFQALRIEVNEELDVLPRALDQAIDLLIPAGRGAVLSYHSGEDRLVKRRFRSAAALDADPRLPVAPTGVAKLVFGGSRQPSAEEQERNPRSGSARLRAIEKVAS